MQQVRRHLQPAAEHSVQHSVQEQSVQEQAEERRRERRTAALMSRQTRHPQHRSLFEHRNSLGQQEQPVELEPAAVVVAAAAVVLLER